MFHETERCPREKLDAISEEYHRTGKCPDCKAEEGEMHKRTCQIHWHYPWFHEALNRDDKLFEPSWFDLDRPQYFPEVLGTHGRPATSLSEYLRSTVKRTIRRSEADR